jgi:hypothetical protein
MNKILFIKGIMIFFISNLIIGCAVNAKSEEVYLPNQVEPNNSFPKGGPVITPFFGDYWMLTKDFTYQINGSDEQIIVPAGFVTDLASIPDAFKGIFDKSGRYSPAGIIHDYLYWEQWCSQNQADRVLKQVLLDTGVGRPTAKSIKAAVKVAKKSGNIPWKNNKKQRTMGYPRIIPEKYREFPIGMKWKKYQKILFDINIKSNSENSKTPLYCKYFNK